MSQSLQLQASDNDPTDSDSDDNDTKMEEQKVIETAEYNQAQSIVKQIEWNVKCLKNEAVYMMECAKRMEMKAEQCDTELMVQNFKLFSFDLCSLDTNNIYYKKQE